MEVKNLIGVLQNLAYGKRMIKRGFRETYF